MTKVKCPQEACKDNEGGVCQAKEIELEQEAYHAPECTMMDCTTKKKGT